MPPSSSVLRLGTGPLTPLPRRAILLRSDGPANIILRDVNLEHDFQRVTVKMRDALEATTRDLDWTPEYHWAVRHGVMWYRASYIHNSSRVFLIDTLETVDVPKDKWRKLPEELHPDVVPPLAVHAQIGGMLPAKGDEWCFDAINYLANLQGSEFEVVPMRSDPVGLPEGRHSYVVDLMVPCVVCDGPFAPAKRKKRPLSSELHKNGWAKMHEDEADLGWLTSLNCSDKTPPWSPTVSSPFEPLNASPQHQLDADCDQLEGRTTSWQPVPFPPATFTLNVTNVIAGILVGHREDQAEELNRMRADLALTYSQELDDSPGSREWVVSDACVFQFVRGGEKEFLRGIITRLDGTNSFVLSVDLGFTARVPISELRVAYDEPSVPPFGIWIVMEDVRPPGGGGNKWSTDAIDFINEIVNCKHNGPVDVALIPGQKAEFPLLAKVMRRNGENVAQLLQDGGYGVFGEPFLFECDEAFYRRMAWGIKVQE